MARWLRQAMAMTRLSLALDRVVENRGAPGIDGVGVFDFAALGDAALAELQGDIICERYVAMPLRRAWLPRPDGKPPRPLGIPTVRDRVAQTAVAQTLAPLLETEFEECSYAYRQGRSVRMAVERIGALQRQGFQWVVEADIERFFEQIPHAPLLARLVELTDGDTALIALVRQWLTAPVRDERTGTLTPAGDRGIPQGSPLSPALANLYLDHLDETLLDADHALVRYADDFVVLARSRERAEAAIELSAEVLHDLSLRLNPLKTRVTSFEQGFQFLGWNFVRSLAVPVKRVVEMAGDVPPPPSPPPPSSPPPAGEAGRGHPAEEAATEARPSPPPNPPPAGGRAFSTVVGEAFAQALADAPGWRPGPVPPPQAETEAEAEYPDADDLGLSSLRGQPLPSDEPDDLELLDETPDGEAAPIPPPSLQRTLYLVDPAASLATENRRLLVRKDGEVLLALPAVNVDQVMLLGRNAVTTPALITCMQHGIPVALLSRSGRFHGRVEPPGGEAVRLQQAQFAAQQLPGFNLGLARQCVQGKLGNAALILSRYARSRREVAGAGQVQDAIQFHRRTAQGLKTVADLDSLRGHEGAAAAAYFAAWRQWLAPDWGFQVRGLTPWLGHLHAVQAGHMALASDLMEEFRPVVVDTVVLNLCLNQRLRPDDFAQRAGAYTLKPAQAKLFIREIETRLNTETRGAADPETQDIRRLMDAQVRRLIQAYRAADPALYQPFLMK